MRKTKEVIDNSGIDARLVRGVVRQLGGRDYLPDVAAHGADAGFPGFCYYSDTDAFFRRHRRGIVALVEQMADDVGQVVVEFIVGFNCVDDCPENRRAIGRAIYGGRLSDDDVVITNALAWFALESVAYAFCD